MQFTLRSAMAVAGFASAAAAQGAVSVTPHDRYSSSVGVLGCHINTNRVAYWPGAVDCNNICVKLTDPVSGRSLHVLKIDSSGGAHDISYDAWSYLSTGTGVSPAHAPQGGGFNVNWSYADPAQCEDLILTADKKLPLSAANSMNYVGGCGANTYAGTHHTLYNVLNSVCTYGYDEVCTLPPPSQGNQAKCPHQLGINTPLAGHPVTNLDYGTGQKSVALQ